MDVFAEPPSKTRKMLNKDLYKPPTNEEINQLNETQNLFHSNLVKLQITELLKEVTMNEKRRKKIDEYLHSLHEVFTALPDVEKFKLNQFSVMVSPDVQVPMNFKPPNVKGVMKCGPPSSVKVIGSYLLHTDLKQELTIDLLLSLPKDCMQAKDFLNQRYLRKRAIYLAYVASAVKNHELVSEITFSYFNENLLKPVLLIKPAGKLSETFNVRLYVCPPEDYFKMKRFLPSVSNLRKSWYYKLTAQNDDNIDNEITSPHTNHQMGQDILLINHLQMLFEKLSDFPSMRDAVRILKVWLRQRGLDKGFGSINGFVMSMLVAYLLDNRRINKLMSSYQIVRITFQFLASTNWSEQGISLNNENDVDLFAKYNEVVFVDHTGSVNLCADTSLALYNQVRHEAKLSLQILDDKNTRNNFDYVFLKKIPFVQKFDQIFHFSKPFLLKKSVEMLRLTDKLADFADNSMALCMSQLVSLVTKALGKRVKLVAIKTPKYGNWPITTKPPVWNQCTETLSIGLLLDSDNFAIPLEKGPLADAQEAEDFRNFWGDKSDLRRFQDSTIREAVLWQCDSQSGRRNIPTLICKHILSLHCGLSSGGLKFASNQIEGCLGRAATGCKTSGTRHKLIASGDEELETITAAYNQFCLVLRNLQNLTLSINSLQGTSSCLRFTEVSPPSAIFLDKRDRSNEKFKQAQMPGDKCPPLVPAIEVICHMEGSGKWPQDHEALQRVKAAFHISLAEELVAQHGRAVACSPAPTHVDVWFRGYVFRVVMAYHREVTILQMIKTPDGMVKVRGTVRSAKCERRTVHLPWLTSSLHGLNQRHPTFGLVCRLAKHWFNSQLLSRHFPAEAVELLCAYMYTNAYPFTPPCSAHVGFIRFLRHVSTFDFKGQPVVVNISGEFTASDIETIHQHFATNRITLPPLFIATATDKTHSVWTSSKPIATILHRTKQLAAHSLTVLENKLLHQDKELDFKNLFMCSLSSYDIIIHLNKDWVPQCIFQSNEDNGNKISQPLLPVVSFDPVELYLQELEDCYNDFALFFNNSNGGSTIGVVWRPNAFETKLFKISNLPGMCVEADSKLTLNVNAFVEDIKIIGDGLVESVELRTEKWKI